MASDAECLTGYCAELSLCDECWDRPERSEFVRRTGYALLPGSPAWRSRYPQRISELAEKRYPDPSRPGGYYSTDRGYGAADYFIGRDGDITSERPHVHVVHNPREGRIIFTVTQRDGSHTATEYLPIDASGNEVNAVQNRLRQQLV